MAACKVPGCCAQTANRSGCCGVHEFARLAKDLTHDGKVLSELKCASCRRGLKPEDWILDQPGKPPRHVQCEPVVKWIRKRDEPKPLFEVSS